MDPGDRLLARHRVAVADATTSWRSELDVHVRSLSRRRILIAGALFLTLHLAGFAVFAAEDATRAELTLRIAVVPFTLVVMAAVFLDRQARQARPLTVIFLLGLAGYIVWTNAVMDKPAETISLVMLVMGSGVLFPLSARLMGLVSGATLALFVAGAVIGVSTLPAVGAFSEGAFYLLAAGALATVGAGLSTALRAREHRARAEVDQAREVAERLLLNTLPAAIVDRLKEAPGAIADGFEEATVLFADLAGFTPLSELLEPSELVEMLDALFSRFDALCERHGCEKIKTMGDSYMAAAGVPTRRPDHADAIAALACDMLSEVSKLEPIRGRRLGLRIGINTGPVVAGVIGTKKFTYDLWGDAVNVAARMESHAEPGIIQLTERTAERLAGRFALETRGTIDVKGKGPMKVFSLRSCQPDPAA